MMPRRALSIITHGRRRAALWSLAVMLCAIALCPLRLAAQVTGTMTVSPVISGQSGSFSVVLTSPNPAHGINGRLLYDPAMMLNITLGLDASHTGWYFAQNTPAPGEICFVLYKIPSDAALTLPNPVLNVGFTTPSGLYGQPYATFEFENEAAARIMPEPDDDAISVGVGGPGQVPPKRVVSFGTYAVPIIGRPVISPNPVSQTVNAGRNVVFSIAALGPGGPFTYQWFGPAGAIGGANGATLQLNAVTTAQAGQYRCDVTNTAGTASSSNATLTVNSPALSNAASFQNHTIPNPVPAGRKLLVGITFRNTSSLTWAQAQGYALAVTSDPSGLFGGVSRVQLSSPELVVAPNATTVFVAFLTIPGSPGTHNASVRMVQEQVEFFGPTAQLVVNVIPQPNSAADWDAYE